MKLKSLLTTLAVAVGLTTAVQADTRIVSYSVAQCWNSSTTGLLTGESYNTMVGTIPLAAWSQPVTGAADVELLSGGYGSILTISKYWDGESAQTFTDVSGFKVEARITGGTNLYGPNGAPTSFGDFRTAVNQALNCNNAGNTITVSGIPFEMYDVIVYFAGGNKKGTNYAMNSVKVNNGSYYYPQSTTAGDNNISASQTTWGDSTSSDLTYGTNVMRINSMMGSTLTLYQYCAAYGIAAIQIIEREVVKHTATVSANTNWNDITWDPAVTEEPADAILELTVENNAVITFDEMPTYKSLTVTGTLNVDTSVLAGEDLAKNAVCGAPYSYWFFTKEVNGTVKASTIPTVPNGYTITEQAVDGFGSRFVVTAPAAAKFGAISLNFHNGKSLESTDITSGLYPVARKDWGNVKAAASASIEVGGATFTLSSNASSWGISSPNDPIQEQYLDDGQGRTTMLTVTGIPYDSYRLILYYSTDTKDFPFQPLQVNGTWYSGETSLVNEGNVTVKGKQAFWGHSGPNGGANAVAEGVNAITTDVLTGDATINLIRPSTSVNARATVAAIQVVKVGQAITAVDYAATISAEGEYNLSELDWSTTPFAPTDKDTVTITVDPTVEGDVTITVDQDDVVMSAFKIVSTDSAAVMVTGNAVAASVIDSSASTGLVSIDFDPGAAEVKAGADTILYTIGTGMITIADGKKLTVTSGTLTDTQVSNSGTLNFAGGTEEEPINFTMNGAATKVTLGANTYVKATPNGNKVYNVTGADETSVFEISRTDDGTGCTDGAKFRNLTLVANVTKSGKYFWLEYAPTDATVQLVSNGNGIYLNGSTTVGSLSGAGYITKYDGSLTIAPAVDADFAGGASVDITIANGTATQTFSGNYTGTLTLNADATVKLTGSVNPTIALSNASIVYVDPNGAAMTFTKAITSPANCGFRVDDTSGTNGSVAFSGDMSGFNGTIDYDNCSYDIGTARTPNIPTYVTISHAVDFVAKQTAAEYAQGLASAFTGFTDYTDWTLVLKSPDGTTIETLTIDENGTATSTASGEIHIDGPATLFDVTFTNKEDASQFAYKAVSDATLQYDSTATFYDPQTEIKDIGVYIKHHPYINGAASTINALGDFTAVFVGTMSPTANRIFVHFGSSLNSNKGILIATKDGTDKVGVFSNVGGTLTELKDLSVPNSASARHVYIVTKKTDGNGDTIFTIYLDGVKRAETKQEGSFVLGASDHCGVQVGADFGGGIRTGTYKAVEDKDTETGVLNVCRIYDYLLSDAQVTAITTEYPYISEGGLYERSVTGAVDYSATKAWTKSGEETAEYDVPTGTGEYSPSAKLTATGDGATITVNTNSTIDTFTFNGSAMSFVKDTDGTNKITVATAVVNAPVTIRYNALDLSAAAISLSGTGALTFDFTDFPLDTYFADAKIQITGMVDQNDTKITAINTPTATGRTATFAYDDGEYYLTITVTEAPFVYDEGWTWNGESVDVEIVSNNTAVAIVVQSDLDWNIDRDGIAVEAGTLTVAAVTKRAANVTVEKDAVLDVNGNQVKEMALTLNGGKVTNGGEKPGEADQIKTLTLTADSEIETPVKGQVYAASYNTATTIALDSYTLTKTGSDVLQVVNIDITGSGTIYVKEGEFYGSEDTRAAGATFKIGADGTLHNRGGKTMTLSKIIGEGGTLNNEGTMSGFELEGTLTIANAGEFGTITNAAEAVVNVGEKRGLTFAGAGTVNAVLTDAEIAAEGPITIFETEDGATTQGGTVVDKDGNSVPGSFTDGAFQVEHKAKIGDVYYLTLQEALDVGGDVVMLADATSEVSVPVGKTVNLDFNGFAITTASRQAINNYGTLTIANGNVTAQESAIVLWGNSETTISGGTYASVDNAVIAGNGLESNSNVTLTVTGGTFNGGITTAGYIACGIYVANSGIYDISGATFNITNGCGICARAGTTMINDNVTFNLVNPGEVGWVGDKKSTVPCVDVYFDWTVPAYPGYEEGDSIYANDNTLTISSDQEWVVDPEYGCYRLQKKVEPQGTVLLISGTTTNRYETIAAAVEAATAGDTVMLTEDMTLDATLALDKAITLDLGEKEITLATAGDGVKVTANATVKNGTLTSQLTANTAVYALHSYKTSATYEDLVIDGANYRFVVYAEGADTIAACYGENDPTTTVTCNNVDVKGNGTLFEAEFTTMNLDANCSGIVEGTPWNYAAAIYSAGNATITIAGGAYTNTLALLSGNLGGSIIVNGGAFGGDIKSWMESDKHTEYHSDPKFKANFMFNAGTYNGAIVFEDSSDAARELDSFSKLIKVAIDAPEGYEWKNFAATQYYHLTKKSDTPSIPASQGAITPVEGKENTYAVSNTTETVDISNLPTGATIILDPSVTYLSGMAENTTVKIVAESTNTTENVVDITGAFKVLPGTGTTATIALKADGEVTIDGETIPVTPTMTEAESSEGTIADGAVATKAIPGLTYTLVRDGDVAGTYDDVADTDTAKGTTVTLKDETDTKPDDKAFYKIQVTK